MTIQRAIVKGSLGSIVEVRNMFTCDVVESGGDDAELLWTTYLEDLYTTLMTISVSALAFYVFDVQELVLGQWSTILEVDFVQVGEINTAALPNAVALVLLGKAAGIRHIGRKFFSGLPEEASLVNTLTAGVVPVAASILLSYITPFTGIGGGTITPGVVDKVHAFHPFVGGVVSSLLGSMRRRKPGLGI